MKAHRYLFLLLISVFLLSCDSEEKVDPEASTQVLNLSITTSSAMVPTYLLTEMTAMGITPGVPEADAATQLGNFFLAEMKCVEVEVVGKRVDIKFLEEPPEAPPPDPTCTDEEKNGNETDIDCGGDACSACAEGLACAAGTDCASGACINAVCTAPSCVDTLKNGTETGPDCGGACGPCADGLACNAARDCTSGVCTDNICQAASCTDAVKNGVETATDCGGGTCGGCPNRSRCLTSTDCAGGACTNNLCQPALCASGQMDGDETGLDCGGSCVSCADGLACNIAADCINKVCTDSLCQAATCTDTIQNGDEAGVDCGGAACPACPVTEQEQEGEEVPAEEAPAEDTNPCEYHKFILVGEASIEVLSTAPGALEAKQTWKGLLNGAAVIAAGTGTMEWGGLADLRRLTFQATWDPGDGPVQGSGNLSQRIVDDTVGLDSGIRIDGEREWLNSAGNWLLTMNGIEIKGGIAAPVRGSYLMRTAAYLTMRMRFEQVDESTITVSTEGRDGIESFRVGTADGAVQ